MTLAEYPIVAANTPEERIALLQRVACWVRNALLNDTAIVAGGAVRDAMNGAPWKDIDVFVDGRELKDDFGEDSKFVRLLREAVELEEGRVLKLSGSDPEYGELLDLADIQLPMINATIQIVLVEGDPVDDVHSYDFALSQMLVTPRELFMTRAAVLDMVQHTVTYTKTSLWNEAAFERSRKRCERLRAKYVGWKFVDCEALDKPWLECLK